MSTGKQWVHLVELDSDHTSIQLPGHYGKSGDYVAGDWTGDKDDGGASVIQEREREGWELTAVCPITSGTRWLYFKKIREMSDAPEERHDHGDNA